ncbi:hypothetical protein DICVIV_10191 [Dictyocaulus viviparus]|uniref:Uncharacterized protein n=1 Tax=Dictyocaulus viviparus TaxID=29172 RepID=A0A0D8XJ23_DICVI|nr:hypothetical protein DICVIV_10191 [Dictyocaulus viviparus]
MNFLLDRSKSLKKRFFFIGQDKLLDLCVSVDVDDFMSSSKRRRSSTYNKKLLVSAGKTE